MTQIRSGRPAGLHPCCLNLHDRRDLWIFPVCALLLFAVAVEVWGQVPQAVAGKLSEESRYWWSRAVGSTARSPAKALIVSRHRFEHLRPLRSWQDVAALRDYVEWSDRAEAAGFNGGEVLADVSTNDLILLRLPFASVAASAKVLRDPIGYAVLDPQLPGTLACPATVAGRPGMRRVCLKIAGTAARVPDLAADLPTAPVPVINAVVRAGPLAVAVYGASLSGRVVRIFSRKGPGQILYAGPNQINAKVPSIDEVCVEVDGMRSEWTDVQK